MYDDDFYNEPSEFDQQIQDLKQSLLKSVKEEFISEMEQLRQENAELQKVKRDFDQIKRSYDTKAHQLEIERQDLQRKVRYERFTEIMKNFHIIVYQAYSKREQLPKCDKCNEKRKITFLSPSGKKLEEDCQCAIGKTVFVPEEYEVAEFGAEENKLKVWYHRRYRDSESYSSTQYAECIYEPGTPYEKIKDRWKTFFTSKEECQAYCDWLNENKK